MASTAATMAATTGSSISPSDGIVKNIESIAVDPKNPNVVYAGTWHLAWKTSDGGANWQHINKGMIDDSDVFSIIVDASNPADRFRQRLLGNLQERNRRRSVRQRYRAFRFTARRTRVLKQDPSNPATVYAGTTEGLWKTADDGKNWKLASSPEIVVNDVLIDPRNSQRVLLATDRSGVLASDNSAREFHVLEPWLYPPLRDLDPGRQERSQYDLRGRVE